MSDWKAGAIISDRAALTGNYDGVAVHIASLHNEEKIKKLNIAKWTGIGIAGVAATAGQFGAAFLAISGTMAASAILSTVMIPAAIVAVGASAGVAIAARLQHVANQDQVQLDQAVSHLKHNDGHVTHAIESILGPKLSSKLGAYREKLAHAFPTPAIKAPTQSHP